METEQNQPAVPLPRGRMDGEDTESQSLEAAQRWAEHYQRLVQLEERVLETMADLGSKESPPIRDAVQHHNIGPLREDLEAFKARLEFWRDRAAQLGR